MSAMVVSNAVLWVVVAVLALVILGLARQIGVLHERIAPAGALTLSGGVKAGEEVPDFSLGTLAHGTMPLRSWSDNGRSLLVFFLSPICPVCKSLLPVVQKIGAEESAWLDVLLASDGGTQAEHEAYVADHDLGALPYAISQELGVALQVGKLPYAALIDAQGVLVAKGLVNTREHLESLLEAKRLGVASINEYIAEAQS